MKNIVLIGLPGSGKTTIGRAFASKKKMQFIDLDVIIETMEGMTIKEIFENHGEEGFRKAETKAVKKAAESKNTVISTGGGVVLREENMKKLAEDGIIVWINRNPESIAKDIVTKDRPLMKDDPAIIFDLFEKRKELYRKYADYVISEAESIPYTLKQLEKILEEKHRFAVIGDPIDHSFSPYIHIPILKKYNKTILYSKVLVAKGNLENWIKRVKKEGISGFSITMPHKTEIMKYLDYIDEEALLFNSVNTVVNNEGKLYGYNTDGKGLQIALQEKGYSFRNSKVLIIGAGGVAKTIALKAAMEKAKNITVLARNVEQANEVCRLVEKNNTETTIVGDQMSGETLSNYAESADILINATPLGMEGIPFGFDNFDFIYKLPSKALVCDLIYNPRQTQLLSTAAQNHLSIMNGLDMLIYQGILADQLFLNKELDFREMYNLVKENIDRKVEII